MLCVPILLPIPVLYYLAVKPALRTLSNTVYSVFLMVIFEISPKKASTHEANRFREQDFCKKHFFNLASTPGGMLAYRNEMLGLLKKLYKAKTDEEIFNARMPDTLELQEKFFNTLMQKARILTNAKEKFTILLKHPENQEAKKEGQYTCHSSLELYEYFSKFISKVIDEDDMSTTFDPYFEKNNENEEKRIIFASRCSMLLEKNSLFRREIFSTLYTLIRLLRQ